jgi:hypothetical protein
MMGKRIGWKLCRSSRGTYEVAEVLEGGIIGRDVIDFPSKEDAEKFIDSDGVASSDHETISPSHEIGLKRIPSTNRSQ